MPRKISREADDQSAMAIAVAPPKPNSKAAANPGEHASARVLNKTRTSSPASTTPSAHQVVVKSALPAKPKKTVSK
jgi:hypothetical protein